MKMDFATMTEQAAGRLRPFIRQTYLDYAPFYSQQSGADVYFKCENLQHTGSFKVRGALNRLLTLDDDAKARGIVTASTGNHGAACAFAMRKVGVEGVIFVPETAVSTKIDNIRRLGGQIRIFGTDGLETELEARAFAEKQGMTYVPPYNDPFVMTGQGTIGLELLAQEPKLDAIFVAVGGGGLIGGIGSYVKEKRPSVQIIGCSPKNSQVMAQSIAAGEILDLPSLPTLSDGTAGGVEQGSITFEPCRRTIDRYVSVSEAEIGESLRTFMGAQRMLIEGAAAVAIAGFVKLQADFVGKRVAIVLCGANISLDVLRSVLR